MELFSCFFIIIGLKPSYYSIIDTVVKTVYYIVKFCYFRLHYTPYYVFYPYVCYGNYKYRLWYGFEIFVDRELKEHSRKNELDYMFTVQPKKFYHLN